MDLKQRLTLASEHDTLPREARLEIERLETRVQELLTHNTHLENERRKLAALYRNARALLIEMTIEMPIAAMISRDDPMMAKAMMQDAPAYAAVHARNEQLEADAWCGASNDLRAFVAAEEAFRDTKPPVDLNVRLATLASFVDEWVVKFRETLKR